MTIRRRAAAVLAGCLMLVALAICAMPVVVSVRHASLSALDPAPRGWDAVAVMAKSRIEFRQTGPGVVQFTPPRLARPDIFVDELIADLGSFTWDPHLGRYVSAAPGRPFVVEGDIGQLDVDVLNGTTAAPIEITRIEAAGSVSSIAHTDRRDNSWSTQHVGSATSILSRSTLFMLSGPEVPQDALESATVSVGPRSVMVPAGESASVVSITWLALQAVGSGVLLLVAAAGISAVAWWVGKLIRWFPCVDGFQSALDVGVGMATLAVAVNSLAYVMSVSEAAVVIAVVIVAASIWRVRKSASETMSYLSAARSLGKDAATLVVPLCLAFWPIFLWGSNYIGEYRTDLFEYTSLASIGRDHSLIDIRNLAEAQAAGTVTSGAGIIWRSIDSLFASMVSVITPLSTAGSFLLAALLIFIVFALGVIHLSTDLSLYRRVMCAGLLCVPLFSGLFVEGYLSQYFFLGFVPILLVACRYSFEPSSQAETPRELWIKAATVGVIASACVAAYPYFFVLVAVAIGAAVVMTSSARKRLVAVGWRTAAVIALAVNGAWSTVANYGETKQYEEGLDNIARVTLLHGYTARDFASILAGTQPYQIKSPRSTTVDGIGWLANRMWTFSNWLFEHGWLWVLVASVAAGLLLMLGPSRRNRNDLVVRASLVCLVVWCAFASVYALGDRPYVAWKAAWTASVMAVMTLGALHLPAIRSRKLLAVAVVAAVAPLWAGVLVVERSNWIVPINSSFNASRQMSVADDLEAVREEISERPATVVVELPGGQPRSDIDRVLVAHIAAIARDSGVGCIGCESVRMTSDQPTCPSEPVLVVRIGHLPGELDCERNPVKSTSLLELSRG